MAAVTRVEYDILKEKVDNMNDLIISFKAEVLSTMEKNDRQQQEVKDNIDKNRFEAAEQRAALATSCFDKLGEVNTKVTYFKKDIERKEEQNDEMKQNVDAEMEKVDE